MTKNLILYTCLVLLVGACKKDHDNSRPGPSLSPNTWTFNGTTYTAARLQYFYMISNQTALEADAAGNTAISGYTLTFTFPTPYSSGQMLITDTYYPNTVFVSALKLGYPAGTNYFCTKTNVHANVTYNNGKASVSFPGSIWLYNQINSSDSAQLSVGTITQQ